MKKRFLIALALLLFLSTYNINSNLKFFFKLNIEQVDIENISLFAENQITQNLNFLYQKSKARHWYLDKLYFDTIFTSKQGQHPPIIKYFLSKKINFETLIILDDILKFSKRLNKSIKETVIWPKMYERMIRYKPFLKYNITKYKMTLKKKVREM